MWFYVYLVPKRGARDSFGYSDDRCHNDQLESWVSNPLSSHQPMSLPPTYTCYSVWTSAVFCAGCVPQIGTSAFDFLSSRDGLARCQVVAMSRLVEAVLSFQSIQRTSYWADDIAGLNLLTPLVVTTFQSEEKRVIRRSSEVCIQIYIGARLQQAGARSKSWRHARVSRFFHVASERSFTSDVNRLLVFWIRYSVA